MNEKSESFPRSLPTGVCLGLQVAGELGPMAPCSYKGGRESAKQIVVAGLDVHNLI